MKLARVVGNVVSTVKDERFVGYKLMIIQYLDLRGIPKGARQIVLDGAHAGIGDVVLVNNDAGGANMILNDNKLIADDTIAGVVDCITVKGVTLTAADLAAQKL